MLGLFAQGICDNRDRGVSSSNSFGTQKTGKIPVGQDISYLPDHEGKSRKCVFKTMLMTYFSNFCFKDWLKDGALYPTDI